MTRSFTRRAFTGGAGAALFFRYRDPQGFSRRRPSKPTSRSTLRSDIGTISPLLHGSFAEHLGSCIYGGHLGGEELVDPEYRGLSHPGP